MAARQLLVPTLAAMAHAAVIDTSRYQAMSERDAFAVPAGYKLAVPDHAPSLEARGYQPMSALYARSHLWDLVKRDDTTQTDIDLKTEQSWYWGSGKR